MAFLLRRCGWTLEMESTMRALIRIAPAATIVLLVLSSSCSGGDPTAPAASRTTAALTKGGTASPTVTSTQPAGAPLDTTLDVHVIGTAFDRGSQAALLFGGLATVKVHTNSTKFVSATELIANVTIAFDADTGKYDVQVTASTGRKGIGTELFAVSALDPVLVIDRNGISVTDSGGHRTTQLTSDGAAPSWGPGGDGSPGAPWRVAFGGVNSAGLSRIDIVRGSRGRPVVQGRIDQAFSHPFPARWAAWSPRGDEIAFTDGPTLWVTDAATLSVAESLYTAPADYHLVHMAWSPTADRIAFVEQSGIAPYPSALKLMSRSTGAVSTLIPPGPMIFIRGVDWARTGDSLAFTDETNGYKLWILNVSTGQLRQVAASLDGATWAPDDRTLASVFGGKLYSVSVATGAVRMIGLGGWPDWRR
jgi:hypothetical protein